MSKVDPRLLAALTKKLGVSLRQVQRLIEDRVRKSLVSRHQAALLIAAESGLTPSRFASPDELAELRAARSSSSVDRLSTTLPPAPADPRPTRMIRPRMAGTQRKAPTRTTQRRGNSVFVVHGRNDGLRANLFRFLRAVGLIPLEWNSLLSKTKKSSPYIGEILDVAFQEAVAVVVLMTPDDEARLQAEFVSRSDPRFESELTPQARPNVLFEAGMAFGRNPSSTVLVQIGNLRPFSDVGGRHVVHLNNSLSKRQELITKLANAGCNVDTTGSDWISEGNLELA